MFMFFRILVTWTLLFAMARYSWAQANQHWRYWTSADGLAESFAWTVTVGPTGNIWVGHGSVKESSWLDGYTVHNLPSPGNFPVLYESRSGQVWANYPIGVQGIVGLYGLQQYNREEKEWVKYELDEIHSASPPLYSLSFLPIAQDRVFFLLGDYLMEFNAAAKRTSRIVDISAIQHEHAVHSHNMSYAQDGGVWITGKKGSAKIRSEAGIVAPASESIEFVITREPPSQEDAIPTEDSVGPSEKRIAAEGRHNGIDFFDGYLWRTLCLATHETITWGGNRSFWELQGPRESFTLCRVENNRREYVKKNKILSGMFNHGAIDQNGVIWIATIQGLARYAPPTWRTPSDFPLMDKVCHAIHEDEKGGIWFLCLDTLVLFKNGQWIMYPLPVPSHWIATTALASLPDGRIAIMTPSPELLLFNPATEIFELVHHPEGRRITFIAPRAPGTIWVETRQDTNVRIEIFDGTSFQKYLDPGPAWNIDELRCLLEDDKGNLWFGGRSEGQLGLYRDNIYYNLGSKYPGNAAFCIHPVGNGVVWISDRDRIYEYDGAEWSVVRSGLEECFSMITSRDGSIWLATWSGIHRYHAGSWGANAIEEGLPDASAVVIFQDRTERIWVGTTRGISLFHPEADTDPPQTFILPGKNIKRIGPDGEAQFIFTGMDKWKYTESNRLLYSHRIDTDAWSPFTESTVATYTGLGSGVHHFQSRAMDRNWNIDPTAAVFEFRVLAPWYKQSLFLVTSVIASLLILILFGMHIHHVLRIERLVGIRTAVLQEQQIRLQTMASELSATEERERRRLASDLHDSVSQSLSLSIMELSSIAETEGIEQIKEQVVDIGQRLEQTLHDTQRMTFDLCPPELYQIGLEAAIFEILVQSREQHGLDFSFETDPLSSEISEDLRYFLFRAVRELILNITKHAKAGQAQVLLKKRDGILAIHVIDDGMGFDQSVVGQKSGRQGGFGLFSIQERLVQLGGTLTIESGPQEGSMVSITVPLKKTEGIHHENPNLSGG